MKGYLEVNLHPYQVDGEVARFTFNTHSLIQDKKVNYSTSIELFSSLHGNEWYKTGGFKEIAIFNGIIDLSYRKTTIKINRIRHQENATPTRTFKDNVELEGDKIIDFLKHKTAKIFKEKGFNDEGIPQYQPEEYRKLTLVALEKEKIEKAIQSCGASTEEIEIIRENQMCYEEPKQTVNISIDGVLSKKQKEKRDGEKKEKQNGKKKREYMRHIRKGSLEFYCYMISFIGLLRFSKKVVFK